MRPASVVLRHPAGWIASGFGAGLLPRAPGTFGSIVALLPWWFGLRHLDFPSYLGLLVLAFAIGIWAADWVIAQTGVNDPSVVVWDEFIGLWITLLLAPPGLGWMLAGLGLFRLFDIYKPWPVGWADQQLHGGFGVMFDDVLAGIYALLVLQAGAYLSA